MRSPLVLVGLTPAWLRPTKSLGRFGLVRLIDVAVDDLALSDDAAVNGTAASAVRPDGPEKRNHESHDTCDHQDHAHHVYVDSFDRCCDLYFRTAPSAIRNISVPMPKTASEVESVVLAPRRYPPCGGSKLGG